MNCPSSPHTLRWLSLAGILGPIILTAAWLIGDWLWAPTIWTTYHISFLMSSDIRYAWLMQIAFIVTGLLTVAFAPAVHCGLTGGRGSLAGPVLIGIGGAANIAAGLFQPRTLGRFNDSASEASATWLHYGAVAVVFVALVVAPFVIAHRLQAHAQAPGLARYSRLTSLAILVLLLIFLFAFLGPTNQIQIGGLFERLAVTIGLLWEAVLAIWIIQHAPARGRPAYDRQRGGEERERRGTA